VSGRPALKRGRTAYATILRRTVDEPLTLSACMEHFGLSVNGAAVALQAMHALRLIHIHHWERRAQCPCTPAYAFGEADDCPYPETTANGRPAHAPRKLRPPRLPVELVALAALFRELRADASTTEELADATGVNRNGLHGFMKVLRGLRLVYRKGWEVQSTGGEPSARWAFGIDKKDAPRPSSKQLRYRTNQRYY
jgi:hypothetical protein